MGFICLPPQREQVRQVKAGVTGEKKGTEEGGRQGNGDKAFDFLSKNFSGVGFLWIDNSTERLEVFWFCFYKLFFSKAFIFFEKLLYYIFLKSQFGKTFQRDGFILTEVLKSQEELSSFL